MTTRPGTWMNHASRLCECWAASRMPPPCGPRITSGTVGLPPSMYRNFAAWLTIWSMVIATKSKIWISTTGRRPDTAAPTPIPTNVGSEMGVSRTRPSPHAAGLPEPPAHSEDATDQAHVLAHQEHAPVARHLLPEGLVERFDEG